MTNSETQTEKSKKSSVDESRSKPLPGARVVADERGSPRESKKPASGLLAWGVVLIALVAGWLGVLHINRWHFGAPVFFLWVGWTAVLLTGRFLIGVGLSAAEETTPEEEAEFWKPVGRRIELMREKHALLKAIKEIEFDHQMGKMSDKDAAELSQFYRFRAIEIIKVLEGELEDEQSMTASEKIERELRARLSVARATAKAKAKRAAVAARKRATAQGGGEKDKAEDAEADRPAEAEPTRESTVDSNGESDKDGSPALSAEVGS